jgi:hypothetical protein
MAKKKPTKVFTKIYTGTFPGLVYLCVNHTQEEFIKVVKDKFEIDEPERIKTTASGSVHTFVQENGNEMYILRLTDWKWTVSHRALLVHEIFHLVMALMSSLGTTYSKPNEEPFAYCMQFLFTEIYEELLKKIK